MSDPTPHGPISGRGIARRAAQALAGHDGDDPGAALPELRLRLRRLAADLRYEDAARLRDRIAALERVIERIDLLYGVDPGPAAREWEWVLAPFGEVARDRRLVHRVAAWPEWRRGHDVRGA